MTWYEIVLILLAGTAAGTINAIVGSGTLVTFPTLLALGYPPVVANVSNNIGLAPGGLSASIGYRRELRDQGRRLFRLGLGSLLGAIVGAVLLLQLPPEAFETIVPVLIGLGCVLVLAQPWITRRVVVEEDRPAHGSWWVWVGVLLAGVYGGYFGAAQGVLLIAILGIGLREDMQRVNAAKNALSTVVNGVAAVVFILVADVNWAVVLLIAIGSIVGGQLGATLGRRIPDRAYRAFVAVVGVAAIIGLLVTD